jgi:GMP synthase (glutamine-hydrolysing)
LTNIASKDMILVIDNGSSFIDDLLACLSRLRIEHEVKSYNELNAGYDYNRLVGYDAIILSGRRSNDRLMNIVNMDIVKSAYKYDIPLLGICYGLEIMVLALHGTIRRMHEKVTGINHVHVKCNCPIVDKGIIDVYENHLYEVARLPRGFVSIASSDTCKNEIVVHNSKKMFGVQFHPEVSGVHGYDIIKRFYYSTLIK